MTSTLVKTEKKLDSSTKPTKPSPKESVSTEPFTVGNYFKGLHQEWQRITWPSRQQILIETIIVVAVVAVFTAYVFLADKSFQLLIDLIT